MRRVKKIATNPSVGQQFRQLPMFMTGAEIREGWQALDADRTGTHRTYPVGTGQRAISGTQEYNPRSETAAWFGRAGQRMESESEIWQRKYDESTGPLRSGLHESLMRSGVDMPVHLQTPGAGVGAMGKPQVLGGHHRIAVMSKDRPDHLMPVLFADTITKAKTTKGHPYS